ncbi:MAG: hypothetical protein ABL901_00920 [Hyphomicrobiaceae bacterium]
MTTLAAPKVALKLTPVLKTIVYSQVASELVKNTGMKDQRQIEALQKIVADGLISKLIVRLRDAQGREETYTMGFPPFSNADSIDLIVEPGKSYSEMLDVSIAAAIQFASQQIQLLKLTPRFEVEWSPKAKANPSLVSEAARTLNLTEPVLPPLPPAPPLPAPGWCVPPAPRPQPVPVRYPQTIHTYTAPPPVPPNHTRVTVAEIKPAKDPDFTFTIQSLRRT